MVSELYKKIAIMGERQFLLQLKSLLRGAARLLFFLKSKRKRQVIENFNYLPLSHSQILAIGLLTKQSHT